MDEEKAEIIMVFVESQICELLYSIKKNNFVYGGIFLGL